MYRPLPIALVVLFLAACGGGATTNPVMSQAPTTSNSMPSALVAPNATVRSAVMNDSDPVTTSALAHLAHITTIGSTVDPINGAVNPYGLAIAPATWGPINAGDLVVCNFNDSSNVQGTGESIISLHPVPGSMPTAISEAPALLGCTALVVAGSQDIIWPTDFAANNVAIVSSSGSVLQTLSGGPYQNPFGIIFAQPLAAAPAFYVSNAADGTIVRIGFASGGGFTSQVIASGFAVNHGAPGGILGPSGLAYNQAKDRLYIVDGANNTLVAFRHVSTIPAHGIMVQPDGRFFKGPSAAQAHLVYSGAPLNGPISTALLPNQNIAIGNTLDPNGKNLIIELSPGGTLLSVRNVDNGASGAIFGMVATGTDSSNTQLYFNDDNTNTVDVLH